jgi:hypothetical protein
MKYILNNNQPSKAEVLKPDENKMIVINSLQWLVQNFTTPRFYEGLGDEFGILTHFSEVC